MFNITVLKMKDILKYMCGIIITLICIITVSKIFNNNSENKILDEIGKSISDFTQKNMIDSLSQSISSFGILEKEETRRRKRNWRI